MDENPLLVRLREQVAADFSGINNVTRARIEQLWLTAGSWRDADMPRIAAASLLIVRAGMEQIAAREAAFEALSIAVQAGRAVPTAVLSSSQIDELLGDDPLVRLAQPVVALRTGLSKDKTLRESIELAARAAAKIATTYLVDTRAAQVAHTMRTSPVKVDGFRRTLGGGGCEFCSRVIGSGRKVYFTEPRPIHTGCDCGYQVVVQEVSRVEANRRQAVKVRSNRRRQVEADQRAAAARVRSEQSERVARVLADTGPSRTAARARGRAAVASVRARPLR